MQCGKFWFDFSILLVQVAVVLKMGTKTLGALPAFCNDDGAIIILNEMD